MVEDRASKKRDESSVSRLCLVSSRRCSVLSTAVYRWCPGNSTEILSFRTKTDWITFLCFRRRARLRIRKACTDNISFTVKRYSRSGPCFSRHNLASLYLSKYILITRSRACLLSKTATIVGVMLRSDHFDGFTSTRKQLTTINTT